MLIYLSKSADNLAMLWLNSKWVCKIALGFLCCQANAICQSTQHLAHAKPIFGDVLHQATIALPFFTL